MVQLFGWNIRRAQDEEKPAESFAPPRNDDGAAIVTSSGYGGSYGTAIDLEGVVKGEADLISQYRSMSKHPEVATAINQIVNESIVVSDEEETVELNLDLLENVLPPQLLEILRYELSNVLMLLEFNTNAYEIFKRWYVDGRLYYHVIIDKERPADGIKELRYVDPRKIKKVKEVKTKRAADKTPVNVQTVVAEYYVYNEKGFGSKQQDVAIAQNVGLKIAKDAVVYVTSGLLDETNTMVLSYLHQSIRPLNMLRTMEDSAVIYRLVRAPERRVWYIDVGSLPKHKAEEMVYDMMTRHRNKLIYDPASGNVRDQRKHVTMLEDIWLSRREGNRGTQVETLDGAQMTGILDEVNYFLKMLYKSLNVPIGRLEPEMMYSLGRPSEITREEVDFSKFIDRVRSRFSELFLDLLEKQLILKGYMSPEEWDEIRHQIKFKYARDNYFAELKEQEIITQRVSTMMQVMPLLGQFVSNTWARKNILRQTEEDMKEMDQEIMEERLNPIYMIQADPEGNPISAPPGMFAPPPMQKPSKNK